MTSQQHRLPRSGKRSKDWRKLIGQAVELGWSWERRGPSHILLTRDQQTLFLSMGTRDPRAIKNTRARLKAAEEERRGTTTP